MAQKLQSRPPGKVVPQAAAPAPVNALSKIDPRLSNATELARAMQSDKFASGQTQQNQKPASAATAPNPATESAVATPASGSTTVNTADVVDIKCMVTPALVKLITDAGGVLLSSSKDDNIITAKIPAAALTKIAASSDVKQISPSAAAAVPATKGEVIGVSNNAVKNINSSKSIVSESVLKSRGQSLQPVVIKTASY